MSDDEDMPDFTQPHKGMVGEEDAFDEGDELEHMLEATLEEAEAAGAPAGDTGAPSTKLAGTSMFTPSSLPRDANGFIDLQQLNAQQRKDYEGIATALMTEQQMARFEDFKRATFKKPMRDVFQEVTGTKYREGDLAVIALAAAAKVLVGELVEEAVAVAGEKGDATPLQPGHIHVAYQRLKQRGQIEV